jgi:hypothetical protein
MLDVRTQLRDYLDATAPAVELEDIVMSSAGSDPVRPLHPRMRKPPIQGWATGAAAAVVVLLLVGGLAWLSRTSQDEVVEPTATTTTLGTTTTTSPTPLDAVGVVGPGSWSVAASFTDQSTSAQSLVDLAAEVRAWPGVLAVAEAPDESAWRELIGDSACDRADLAHLCDVGIVVLVTLPWMEETARRLESESGMTAVNALDVPVVFWDGYASKVADSPPLPLDFDPTSLGVEVPTLERRGTQIAVDFEGVNTSAAVIRGSDGSLVLDGESVGTGFSVDDLLVDRSGHGGVLAALDGTMDLEALGHARRVYVVAGLPVDAAVVTFELVDGTRVWQRPSGGMALFIDKAGSVPEEYRIWHTSEEATPSPPPWLRPAKPLAVLDAEGIEIMRIEDVGLGRSVVTDLRVDPDLTRLAGDTPVPPSRAFPAPIVSDPTVVQVSEGSTVIELGIQPWDQIAVDDAIWVSSRIGQTEVLRIDTTTLQVTDTVGSSGWELYLAAGALWSFDRNEGTAQRIDLNTRQVTDTIVAGNHALVVDDSIWFLQGSTWQEVNLTTREIGREWRAETEYLANWSAAIDGAIWSWFNGEGISRLDLRSGQLDVYPNGDFPGESDYSDVCCVYSNDAIFLVHPDGLVVRFPYGFPPPADSLTRAWCTGSIQTRYK